MEQLHVGEPQASLFRGLGIKEDAAAMNLRISNTIRSALVTGAGSCVGSAFADEERCDLAFTGIDKRILIWFTLHISY